jgi:hypothetical protein
MNVFALKLTCKMPVTEEYCTRKYQHPNRCYVPTIVWRCPQGVAGMLPRSGETLDIDTIHYVPNTFVRVRFNVFHPCEFGKQKKS